MLKLNLPEYELKVKSSENKFFIFDIIRKKYVRLTPEEWVRQHFVHYLIREKKYPAHLIAVEKQIRVNRTLKRFDILVFDKNGAPNMIVECKAPSVAIDQGVFDQIARYNRSLNAQILVVSNGLEHYFAQVDNEAEKYLFLKDLPVYAK